MKIKIGYNVEYGYCLTHERMFPILRVELDGKGNRHLLPKYIHPETGEGGFGEACHGPFAFVPPPPPLTEEEWETILEKEYYRYAS